MDAENHWVRLVRSALLNFSISQLHRLPVMARRTGVSKQLLNASIMDAENHWVRLVRSALLNFSISQLHRLPVMARRTGVSKQLLNASIMDAENQWVRLVRTALLNHSTSQSPNFIDLSARPTGRRGAPYRIERNWNSGRQIAGITKQSSTDPKTTQPASGTALNLRTALLSLWAAALVARI